MGLLICQLAGAPLIGIAASVARVSVFLPHYTMALFVTLCGWHVYWGVQAGVLGCSGQVYWGNRWLCGQVEAITAGDFANHYHLAICQKS